MNLLRKKLLFSALFPLFCVNAISAYECVRPGYPVAEEFKRSTAVFSGKVIDQGYRKMTDPSGKSFGTEIWIAEIETDRWWKGSGNSKVIVLTTGARVNGDVTRPRPEDIRYQTGESYLIYAHGDENRLSAAGCTRTKNLSEAAEDLRELGEGAPPGKRQDYPPILTRPNGIPDMFKDIPDFSVRIDKPKLERSYRSTIDGEKTTRVIKIQAGGGGGMPRVSSLRCQKSSYLRSRILRLNPVF